MKWMFAYSTLFDADLSKWDVSNVYDMKGVFSHASSFHGNGLEYWNITNANTTAYMFAFAVSFDANLSQWDISHVENTTYMFENATKFNGVWWIEDDMS